MIDPFLLHIRAILMKKREKAVMRLKDRVAIVVGAGQSPGEGMGNGRATALRLRRSQS